MLSKEQPSPIPYRFFFPFIQSVLYASKLTLSELLLLCRRELKIREVRGTNLYVVRSRLHKLGFINVSDISSYVYCPRRFWYMYRLLGDEVKGVIICDRHQLRRLLVGTYAHLCFRNFVNYLTSKLRSLGADPHLYTEDELYDYEYGLAGHVDLVYVDPHEDYAVVYELKSSYRRRVHDTYIAQVLSYCYLVEKAKDVVVDRGYIVNCSGMWRIPYAGDERSLIRDLLKEVRRCIIKDEPPSEEESARVENINKCRVCGFRCICLQDLETEKKLRSRLIEEFPEIRRVLRR